MVKLISAAALRELAGDKKQISLSEDCVLTPGAKDVAKEIGLTILRGGMEVNRLYQAKTGNKSDVCSSLAAQIAEARAAQTASKPDECCQTPENLQEIVKKVLAETMKPACPNPRAVHVRGNEVIDQPFDKAPEGQKVTMTDVVTSRDANLGAGFMTYDHSYMPWHLTYDEIDYVIEGEFYLKVGNEVFTAKPGDVLYIPKDSQVVFGSPSFARVFYVVYPSNWDELCD